MQQPNNSNPLHSKTLTYLKGVGTIKAELMAKELGIYTYYDLLNYYPYRHIDKTNVTTMSSLTGEDSNGLFVGKVISTEILGAKQGKRFVANITDGTGIIELVWFRGINWAEKYIELGNTYLVYGKLTYFNGMPQLSHPEIELHNTTTVQTKSTLDPIYSTTEKLKIRGLSGKGIGSITAEVFRQIQPNDIIENIPESIITKLRLMPRMQALYNIHFPATVQHYQQAVRRLKFEELFIAQVRLQQVKIKRNVNTKGILLPQVGSLFTQFYNDHIPFALTNAQKRVVKEIRHNMATGVQMNRLLQGDVGSGKTMVALLSMLIAIGNGYQACLMAPTEILAQQHYKKILEQLLTLPVNIAILTGSVKAAKRRKLLSQLLSGEINLLIGTHALIEPTVIFANLGLVVIDEQHRFGVEQRSQLWKKNIVPPHILVMTATPIPRTLAMTAYGDLEVSVIDELPPGRQAIITTHKFDDFRIKTYEFIQQQIALGRQAYIVFPLIEESEKLDFENLMQGYENVKAFFPEPKYLISMVHGKMPNETKETNMQRFVAGNTQIMVATTVIEVGVDVPNASIMIIESAEKFGLSQLHQLRGRVGRGASQSYCILLTSHKLTHIAKQRMGIMVQTNDGFAISEKDLELRGPGDIEGLRQSGALNFKLADIVQDKAILEAARNEAEKLVTADVNLQQPEHKGLQQYLIEDTKPVGWGKIS